MNSLTDIYFFCHIITTTLQSGLIYSIIWCKTMKYYDFDVKSEFSEGESSIQDIAERAKLLGFKGICFSEHFKNEKQMRDLKERISEVSEKTKIEILLGFEAKTIRELDRLKRIRMEYDVLLVEGSNLNLNRRAVETKEVDILTHPEFGRKDSGFNHVMARLAHENNVAIEINFRQILLSSKKTRSHIIHNMRRNIMLCKKYKTPIVISSGAISHWQLKDPKVLISMGCLLGLELEEAKKALSEVPENIIKMIRKKQDKKWIRPGVEVVE